MAPEYTGVSTVPGNTPLRVYQEQMSKYAFAARYVARLRVLDVGCAAGMGVDLFRRSGCAYVVGVEYNPDTLWSNPDRYTGNNAVLVRGDARALPIASRSIDLVVMLEIIEHIEEDAQVLAEVARVMRADATLICSTPNVCVSRKENPHHVREYTIDAFSRLLGAHFGRIEMYGQSFVRPDQLMLARGMRACSTLLRGAAAATGVRGALRRLKRSLQRPEPIVTDVMIDVSRLAPAYAITPYDRSAYAIPSYFMAVCRV